MSSTATNAVAAAINLKDMRLFREACYVDSKWVQAAGGGTVSVDNPATGEIIGRVPKLSGAERGTRLKWRTRLSSLGVRAPRRNARMCCASGST